jgi:1-acyl-sn-glycerol-3-phosphate acyltransferase
VRSFANALLSAWTWLEIGVVVLIGFVVQLALFASTALFDRRRRVAGRCFRLIGVLAAKLSWAWQFGVSGPLPAGVPGRTVVVSNHESNADPFLISFLPWEMKWLSKASLFRIPFVGWCMRLAGDIPLDRGSSDSARAAMVRCAQWLEIGMPVMIFPEGTRSTTEEMLPFKDGAFRLAIEKGADVLPLAVCGTRRALPKHSWRFEKSRARVAVGSPISTQGMGPDDVDRLKSIARGEIQKLRDSLRGQALNA